MGFSYDGVTKEENTYSDDEDDDEDEEDDDDEFNSDDSTDEGMDVIAKEFGVKRYGWLVHMDKKAKEEEKRQKEVIKGDPAIVSYCSVGFVLKGRVQLFVVIKKFGICRKSLVEKREGRLLR